MSLTLDRRSFLQGAGSLGLLGLLSGCATSNAGQQSIQGVPAKMVWSGYSVGTGTYNDFAAIANSFTNQAGIQVRLLSADTGVGRIAPTINRTASIGRTSVEYYYAFEGAEEFCSEVWGPQSVRLMWAPPGNYGIFVRRDSGIETVEDLRGRRVPYAIAATAVNRNIEAMLNYGGLTYDDVEVVEIGYSEQTEALKTGQIEVMYNNPSGSAVQELATEYDIRWLDFSSDEAWRFETWEDLIPMVTTGPMEPAPGMEDGESVTNLIYSLPVITVEEQDADEVHSFLQLLVEYYDDYKDATADVKNFAADQVMLSPLVVPFHEGAVRYFQETGRWTPGLQRRQDALLEREQLMAAAWPDFWSQHSGADDPARIWKDWKTENLPALPSVDDLPADQPDAV